MPKDITVSDDGFINMLKSINGGAVIEELDRELIKGVAAIFDHGGKSDITLKISLSRIKNMNSAVTVAHDVKVSHPKEERPASAMFVSKGNGLVDQHQKQESFDLQTEVQHKPSTLQPVESKVSRLTPGKTTGEQ